MAFLQMPAQVEKFITRAISGQLTYNVKGFPSAARLLYAGGHQLICALLSIAAGGAGIYFHHEGEIDIAHYCWYGAGGFIALLLVSMLRARKHKRGL
jgi:hypothetical protein